MPFADWPFIKFRLPIDKGGVSISGGEIKVDARAFSIVLEVTEDVICDSIVVSRIAAVYRVCKIEKVMSEEAPERGRYVDLGKQQAPGELVCRRFFPFAIAVLV